MRRQYGNDFGATSSRIDKVERNAREKYDQKVEAPLKRYKESKMDGRNEMVLRFQNHMLDEIKKISDVYIAKRESYDMAIAEDLGELKSKRRQLADAYDKNLKIENFIQKVELETHIQLLEAERANKGQLMEEFEYKEDSNPLLNAKHAYELNMLINSIYERNDPDGKLNSAIYMENPALDFIHEHQDLLDFDIGQGSLKKDDNGRYKMHQGYHKILYSSKSYTTAVFEWTGRYPTVVFYVLDPRTMELHKDKTTTLEIYNEIKADHLFEANHMNEVGDLKTLKDAMKFHQRVAARKDFPLGNKWYVFQINMVRSFFRGALVNYKMALEQNDSLFIDPFHFDGNGKAMQIKQEPGFLSDRSSYLMRVSKMHNDSYINVLSNEKRNELSNEFLSEEDKFEANHRKLMALPYIYSEFMTP